MTTTNLNLRSRTSLAFIRKRIALYGQSLGISAAFGIAWYNPAYLSVEVTPAQCLVGEGSFCGGMGR